MDLILRRVGAFLLGHAKSMVYLKFLRLTIINYMRTLKDIDSTGCLVCGEAKTVKSHILPRSLMHDLRGNGGQYVHEIAHGRVGTKYLQSGPIDKGILCLAHEQLTQEADKYGAEFCRRILATVPQGGPRAQVPNPQPDLLVKFACQTVWRMAVSKHGLGEQTLGPYAPQLREMIFAGSGWQPLVFLARNHLTVERREEAKLAIAPFPVRLGSVRCWLFSVSGVQFYVKLDQRLLPGESDGFAANGADPVTLMQLDRMEAHQAPILKELMRDAANQPK